MGQESSDRWRFAVPIFGESFGDLLTMNLQVIPGQLHTTLNTRPLTILHFA